MTHHSKMLYRKTRFIALGLALCTLFTGCASISNLVSRISGPKEVAPESTLVSYNAATCQQLAPELVSWARQEYQLTSAQAKAGAKKTNAAALTNVRNEKQAVRTAMKANGCF